MSTASQAYRKAANSDFGREASHAAKVIGDEARSIGDEVGDFASDVSRQAGRQFRRAKSAASDVYDEAHELSVQNPHATLALALGIGFLFGVILASRR
jgi:ElaB/YqjD/DUF883 family membrane-anchored ribosome-binding protein